MRVGLVYDPIYLEHDTGQHVENASRLRQVMSHLEESHLSEQLVSLSPQPASVGQLAMVHAEEHISRIRNQAQRGGGWLDGDTVMSPASYEVALYAAGGAIKAVEAVMNKEVDSAFALVRPPGHHATCWQAMGFCLFNNIAIAAKHALANLGVKRLLIADFDVHHGNGTQEAFYTDPSVLYFSTHQYPFYPGTGSIEEDGAGEGKGATVNMPLPGWCGDEEYLRVFEQVLVPLARRFKPQLILVSAGFDAHWADNISLMQVSVSGYARMAEIFKGLAAELCGGRLVFALEGGYYLPALAASIRATLDVLLGNPATADPLGQPPRRGEPSGIDIILASVKERHGIS